MVIRRWQFNLILAVLVLVGLAGCSWLKPNPKKAKATLRVHLECNPQLLDRTEQVTVLRAAPMRITIEKFPFLSEALIESAQVIDQPTGYLLSIKFNQQGSRLLEQYSALNAYRRFAIRAQFRQETNVFDRWLAAPVIQGRISTGILTFTPDASRTECDDIVRGWNNSVGYKPAPESATNATNSSKP